MNKKVTGAVVLAGALGLFTGVVSAGSARLSGTIEVMEASENTYTYVGPLAERNWGDIAEVCDDGLRQSPVRLRPQRGRGGFDAPGDDPIIVDYEPSQPFEIENLGSTIEFPQISDSNISIGGVTYDLLQFHIHADSEHTIRGKSYPLEIHFVHLNAEGNAAVLGVMVDEGDENEAIASTFGSPREFAQLIPGGDRTLLKFDAIEFDPSTLLPEGTATYRYTGSLTTPPCSEIVDWYVYEQPIEMSEEQLEVLTDAVAGLSTVGPQGRNDRKLQDLEGREILLVD
ncbi:MAG: carbonic anhydrase family protein [Actinomycetota bacterium]